MLTFSYQIYDDITWRVAADMTFVEQQLVARKGIDSFRLSVNIYTELELKPFWEPRNRFPAWQAGTTTKQYTTYRPTRLHRPADSTPWNRFLDGLLKRLQIWVLLCFWTSQL
jgi:hypothetical protein